MLFNQSREFPYVVFLIRFHLFPKRNAVGAVGTVFFIHMFNAPETFMFLNQLVHQIINVIVEHAC